MFAAVYEVVWAEKSTGRRNAGALPQTTQKDFALLNPSRGVYIRIAEKLENAVAWAEKSARTMPERLQ
jgi:hypothetical protein